MKKGKRVELSSEKLLDIKDKYARGFTLKTLASEVECSIPTIRKLLLHAGVAFRSKGTPKKNHLTSKSQFIEKEQNSDGQMTFEEFKEKVTKGLPIVKDPVREW